MDCNVCHTAVHNVSLSQCKKKHNTNKYQFKELFSSYVATICISISFRVTKIWGGGLPFWLNLNPCYWTFKLWCKYLLNLWWKRRQHHFWIGVFNMFCSLVENERCKQVAQHNNQIHLGFLGDSAIFLWFTNPSQGSRSQKIHKCQVPRVMVVEVSDYASKQLWLSFIV